MDEVIWESLAEWRGIVEGRCRAFIEGAKLRPTVLLCHAASGQARGFYAALEAAGRAEPWDTEKFPVATVVMPAVIARDCFCRPDTDGLGFPNLTAIWATAGPEANWLIEMGKGKVRLLPWVLEDEGILATGDAVELAFAE